MSWMDSWSRPSKHQATPAPYYLLPGGESTPYCRSCGRVVGSRKSDAGKNETPAKYCSSRCKSRKPGALDRRIEDVFVALLSGEDFPAGEQTQDAEKSGNDHAEPLKKTHVNEKQSKKGKQKRKNDPRVLISCATVEALMFGDRFDPEKTSGRNRDRARRGMPDTEEWTSVDMEEAHTKAESEQDRVEKETVDGDILARMSIRSGTRVRPPQNISEVNGGVGGEKGRAERIEESEEMLERRVEGQRKAHQREMVRCAARRGVAFGFLFKKAEGDHAQEERKKCEAVMHDQVVEPSFAKGDWSIRWREDNA
ncbi:hypothetical protein Q7P37_001155 [Cladosporium fusiforme]